MKTKIKILIVSCVMAAAAVTGFNMAQNSNIMDVSLADIAVMARADGESGGGIKYCWTNPSMGGLFTITPCGKHDPNSLPPYQCGTPISWCWAGGTKQQCY